MNVSVLLATHQQSQSLRRTLRSVAEAGLPSQVRQVLVVENGTRDQHTADVCSEFVNVLPLQYRYHEPAGKSRALNWAIRNHVDADFIILFDDDVRIAPGIFEDYISAAEQYGPKCYYGGSFGVDYEEGGEPPAWLVPYLPLSAVGWSGPSEDQSDALFFLGFNYAFFRSSFWEAGGFNEAIGPGAVRQGTESNPVGQETDFMQRLLKAGYRSLFVADAKVWHFVPRQRCTPQWTLHRRYRQSLTSGLSNPDFRHGRKLYGVPLWIWKNALLSALVFPASYLPVGSRRRFFLRKSFYEYWGRIRGLLQRRSAIKRQPNGSVARADRQQHAEASSE